MSDGFSPAGSPCWSALGGQGAKQVEPFKHRPSMDVEGHSRVAWPGVVDVRGPWVAF